MWQSHIKRQIGVSVDIRLISKFQVGKCIPIEEDLILQEIDDNYQLNSFTGKKLYVVDVVNNTRQEILPMVKKYNVISIYNAQCNKDYIYFTTATRQEKDDILISLIQYGISDGSEKLIYTLKENLVNLETNRKIKIFILDENYIFIQKELQQEIQKPLQVEIINNENIDTYHGVFYIENFLYSVEDNSVIDICDETIGKYGIDKILPVEGNICAIKVGYSILEECLYEDTEINNLPTEIIGIINIKQFISDLVLKKEQVFIEILDNGATNRTFPYLKYREGNIVYSRVDIKNHKEEVVIYDYETKVTKIRVNNHLVRISDLWRTYIINDAPYLLKEKKDSTQLINLNTQKVEWKLGSEDKIKYIANDIIIIEKHIKKSIFRKENYYIVAYKYPEVHKQIFREKARFVDCLITGEDNLLIFSS